MLRYLVGLAYVAFMAQVWLTWRYHYLLLYHLSYGALIVIVFWIVGTLMLGLHLKEHARPEVRRIGEVYETLFSYSAPMQGVFYTTMVFYFVGATTMPATAELYLLDWMFGMIYAGGIIYGIGFASFLMVAETFLQKLATFSVMLIAWALMGYFFLYEEAARRLYAEQKQAVVIAFFGLQIVMSVLSMLPLLNASPGRKIRRKRAPSPAKNEERDGFR